MEELGELSSLLLVREGFKYGSFNDSEIEYVLAEVLFEVFKLAEDCNVDLERVFTKALEKWRIEKPRWI